jgi:molybdenum cofactor cytidylyltransferase
VAAGTDRVRSLTATPVAIVLAAGRGQRFAAGGGGPFKQSRPIGDSASLAEHVCNLYADCGLPVVCALHPQLTTLASRLTKAGHHVVVVADADLGMGHSLAAAVAAAPSDNGWLIALADMPSIRADTIRAVADALVSGASLCAPFHGGKRGHPVGFGTTFGPRLRALTGDQGARSIIQTSAGRLRRLDVDDPGILTDFDRPDEWPET